MINFDATKPYEMIDLTGDKPELKFDWQTFDVSFEDYFYLKNHPEAPNAQVIDKLFELIYAEVARNCNEDGNYTIMCFKNRYKVVRIDEMEQVMYDEMSDEEKVAYDEEKRVRELEREKSELQSFLNNTDYVLAKISEAQLTGSDEEVASVKEEYAETLQKRKEARTRINEIEADL